jgi:hypothetical protein
MLKVHLPQDRLPENSPEARGRRFMDRVNQARQLWAERQRAKDDTPPNKAKLKAPRRDSAGGDEPSAAG